MKPSLPIALTAALLIGSVSIVAAKSPARPAPKPASAAAAAAVKATPPAKTAGTAAAALLALKAHQIIKKMDTVMQGRSTISEIEMKIVTPHWRRTLRMKSWTKGLDLAFVRILSPRRERGVASLKRGTDMWNYFPRADMITRIPPSMMLGSWMGSDFTNDDLVKASNVVRDYNPRVTRLYTAGGLKMAVLTLVAKPAAPVVWAKLVIHVRLKDSLPTRQEYRDQNGKLLRLLTFSDFKKMDDRVFPTRMRMRSMKKKNRYTEIRYLKIKFDRAVKGKIFKRRNLKRKSW